VAHDRLQRLSEGSASRGFGFTGSLGYDYGARRAYAEMK